MKYFYTSTEFPNLSGLADRWWEEGEGTFPHKCLASMHTAPFAHGKWGWAFARPPFLWPGSSWPTSEQTAQRIGDPCTSTQNKYENTVQESLIYDHIDPATLAVHCCRHTFSHHVTGFNFTIVFTMSIKRVTTLLSEPHGRKSEFSLPNRKWQKSHKWELAAKHLKWDHVTVMTAGVVQQW